MEGCRAKVDARTLIRTYFAIGLQLQAEYLRPMEWGARERRSMKAIRNVTVEILAAAAMLAPALVCAANLPDAGAAASALSPTSSLEQRVQHELRMIPYYGVFDDLSFTVAGDRVTLTGEVTNPVVRTD